LVALVALVAFALLAFHAVPLCPMP